MTRSKIQWFLTIAGLPGIVSLFLPFQNDISPFIAFVFWGNILFKICCSANFFTLVIFVFLIRSNFTGKLSKWEQIISYLISLPMIVFYPFTLFMHHKMTIIIFLASIFLICFSLIITNYFIGKYKSLSSIMLMQTVYLLYISPGLILCKHLQIGAWFILATIIIYAAQMIWITCQKETSAAV